MSKPPHFLNFHKSKPDPDPVRFVSLLDNDGTFTEEYAALQPEDYRHVVHLGGRLYYAWDGDPSEDAKKGAVFVAAKYPES